MKTYLQLILISTIFTIFSCKENLKIDSTQNQVIKKDTIEEIKTVSKPTTPLTENHAKFKFITAESGLNFRDSPNGKVLGKFNWRDKVEYLFSTEHSQKIIDNYREIEGNWIAVKHKEDTVYVFNHYDYISYQEPKFSKLKLYNAEPYLKYTLRPSNELDIRQAFVNVSESFYMPENFIDKKDLRKDTITFNKKQRTEFLKRMNYSNKDTLYIYDITSGLIKKHSIENTPLMACISIYSQVNEEYKTEDYDTWDYQYGFNLGKADYGGFAVIGKENPFIEKGLQPLIFEEMNNDMIDNHIKNKLIPSQWKNDTMNNIYTSEYEKIRSFVKKRKESNYWSDLTIKDIETKDSFFIYLSGGEGSGKSPIKIKGEKTDYNENYHYIGRLFKNKPPVAFGFVWESFGCSIIDFLDKEELPVVILCDNRH